MHRSMLQRVARLYGGHNDRCQTPNSDALEQPEPTGTTRYQYRSLDRSRQEIRLLTLEPGSGTDIIRCTLKHAFLDATPPPLYENISYVCGDPSNKNTILLHGHETQAMETSEAALRRMRLPDKPRISWIDSICIDQNNTDERGHQVGIMRRIYGTTSQNLVWLGPYDNTIAESINAMEVMLQEVAIEARDYADFGKFSFENDRFPRFSKDRVSNTVGCLALLRLLDNPWSTRLWIVQEASLAPSIM